MMTTYYQNRNLYSHSKHFCKRKFTSIKFAKISSKFLHKIKELRINKQRIYERFAEKQTF